MTNATAGISTDQRGLPFDSNCPSGFIDAGATQTGSVILSANNIAFDGTTVDALSASQWVSVVNKSSAPVSIHGITLAGADASQFGAGNNCGSTLAAGANCFVHVHFQPTVTGPATAAVTITNSVAATPQTIVLNGTGVAPTATGPLYAAVTITYSAAGSPISIGLSGTGQ